MNVFSRLFRSRGKPTNSYDNPSYSYFFGRSNSGKRVSDRTAMQHTVVHPILKNDFTHLNIACQNDFQILGGVFFRKIF